MAPPPPSSGWILAFGLSLVLWWLLLSTLTLGLLLLRPGAAGRLRSVFCRPLPAVIPTSIDRPSIHSTSAALRSISEASATLKSLSLTCIPSGKHGEEILSLTAIWFTSNPASTQEE